MTHRQFSKIPETNKHTTFPVQEADTLLSFLYGQLAHKSRTYVKSLLGNRQVSVDGKIVSQFDHPLSPGQKVEIGLKKYFPENEPAGFKIVYEDNDLLVIDKPAGLLSISTETEKQDTAYSMVSDHVKKLNKSGKIFIVHRLDRETSGLMVFAKNEDIKHRMQDNWDDIITERNYLALVEGVPDKPEGTITSYLFEDKNFKMHSSPNPGKGLLAITHYNTLKKNRNFALLKVSLETGRKNQIRVHLQEAGHPVAGDKKYGATTNPIKRLGLHAQQLSFIHPSTGEKMNFETPVPKAFLRIF